MLQDLFYGMFILIIHTIWIIFMPQILTSILFIFLASQPANFSDI